MAQVPNGAIAQCLTCHVYPGGPRNAFGETVEHYGGVGFLDASGNVQWGTIAIADPSQVGSPPKTLAELDPDGDGRTSGEELQDPTGAWRIGQSNPGNSALVRLPGLADASIVIREIYAGGGESGAAIQHDFIELFNRSNAPVSLAGWSLQYAPATGPATFGSGPTSITELPSVVLAPGQSFLVREGGAGSGSPLLTPDLTDPTPISLPIAGGRIALVSTTTPIACNGEPIFCSQAQLSQFADLVGYGNALFYEGLWPAPALSATAAITRARAGCTDVNSNGAFPPVPPDFSLASIGPRNMTSPLAPCGGIVAVPAAGPLQLGSLLALLLAVGFAILQKPRTLGRIGRTVERGEQRVDTL